MSSFYLFGQVFAKFAAERAAGQPSDSTSVRYDILMGVMKNSNKANGLLMGGLKSQRYPYASILVSALSTYSENDCSDPRDRIYALLSLDPGARIAPDYTLSTVEVYTRFASALVRHGMLKFLLVQFRIPSSIEDDLSRQLPSWVPDFRKDFLWQIIHDPIDATVLEGSQALSIQLWCLGRIKHVYQEDDRRLSALWADVSRSNYDWVLHLPSEQEDQSIDLELGDLVCSTSQRLEGETTQGPAIDIATGSPIRSTFPIAEMVVIRFVDDVNGAYKIGCTFESTHIQLMSKPALERPEPLPDGFKIHVNIV
jgi:hypothetical protein